VNFPLVHVTDISSFFSICRRTRKHAVRFTHAIYK
jgi:hypothetical protein